MSALEIEVVSDVVCPWCFIGKRHLDTALSQWRQDFPDRPVNITWRPYFLNPDTPVTGEAYRPFLEQKFGSAQAVDELLERVAAAGARAGVDYAFDKITLRANTLRAHRLIHYVQKVGAGETARDALIERLFVANFQRGEHVGDLDVLVGLATECGLEADKVRNYLESDEDSDLIRRMADEVTNQGVGGVPCFVFNRRLATTGAQPPEQLRLAMEEAYKEGPPALSE